MPEVVIEEDNQDSSFESSDSEDGYSQNSDTKNDLDLAIDELEEAVN